MAIANPGPAADLDHVSSPNRSESLRAGPGVLPTPDALPRRPVDLTAIAEGFAVSAPAIAELQDPVERTWVLLAVTDLFEAWAIAWPTGGTIELHDHGRSHGAIVVASGELTETTVRSTSHALALIDTHLIVPGVPRRIGPGDVHSLTNEADQLAVSVHVYGPCLSAMSYYRLNPRGQFGVIRTETIPPVGPFDSTSDHDPS
jgi:hypothetical protein